MSGNINSRKALELKVQKHTPTFSQSVLVSVGMKLLKNEKKIIIMLDNVCLGQGCQKD